LLAAGRVPECYIPPSQALEWRALLELYHDLRVEHTGWAKRVHATCFHQGATPLGEAGVVRGCRQRLESIVAEQLSPVGRLQVNTALAVMDALAEHLDPLRRRLAATARHVDGARALIDAIYGVGPMTALALCAWLGGADRFSSARKAVRFVGRLFEAAKPPPAAARPDSATTPTSGSGCHRLRIDAVLGAGLARFVAMPGQLCGCASQRPRAMLVLGIRDGSLERGNPHAASPRSTWRIAGWDARVGR
jgi:hypothetical protein